jgi:hypothetical protein
MAEHEAEYHHGDMDVSEQANTYAVFGEITKWSSLVIGVMVLVLTIWFCTDLGFFAGLIPGIVLFALGVIFLRRGPSESH